MLVMWPQNSCFMWYPYPKLYHVTVSSYLCPGGMEVLWGVWRSADYCILAYFLLTYLEFKLFVSLFNMGDALNICKILWNPKIIHQLQSIICIFLSNPTTIHQQAQQLSIALRWCIWKHRLDIRVIITQWAQIVT